MSRRLVYTDAAGADLITIANFIADESGSEDIGEAFVLKLEERCRRLASLPGILGAPRPELNPDMRSTPHQAYVIFFRYGDDSVEIVNVLHGRRDVIAYYEVGDGG